MSEWVTELFFFGVAFRGVSASSASTAGGNITTQTKTAATTGRPQSIRLSGIKEREKEGG